MLKDAGVDYLERLEHVKALEASGINPFPAEPPKRSHKNAQLLASGEELFGSRVSVVGRMISKRGHGGLTFAHLEDESAAIQTVIQKNVLGDLYPLITKYFGVGDFIGATGALKPTKTGELSVWADEVVMLSKALRVAPHRLTDPELQQRERYVHTLTDPEARERFRIRSRLVQSMREYFTGKMGCIEMETPVLDSTYGGASAKPFVTHHNALDRDFYLRISNELYLKRMTVGGYYEGVFEFSRDFRNEGIDRRHNPEFTLLELYKPWWDYNKMMDMAEDLISGIVTDIHGSTVAPYEGNMIDYKKPWRRLAIYDGIRQKTGLDPKTATNEQLRNLASTLHLDVEQEMRGGICLKIFENLWEHELINPTFVMDYPADTSALTKRHRDDPNLTERFEVFVGGMEVMNCYSELNDPRDQRARFETEQAKRKQGDSEAMEFDEDFIKAMEYGMPLQSGIGISVDRWTMLLTNTPQIRQAIYFPSLRSRE